MSSYSHELRGPTLKTKAILVALPLVVSAVLVSGFLSAATTRHALTTQAVRFLSFKAEQLESYARGQWRLLVENEFTGHPVYERAARDAVISYAATLTRGPQEWIVALDSEGKIAAGGLAHPVPDEDREALMRKIRNGSSGGWVQFQVGGTERVGYYFAFEPFDWVFVVSDTEESFYSEVRRFAGRHLVLLVVTTVVSGVLMFFFGSYLSRPIGRVVAAMRRIVDCKDFSGKIEVTSRDEIGLLAHEFNVMTGNLETAYNELRDTAVAETEARREVSLREHETLAVMGRATEYKDPETGAHVVRVGLYSALLGRLMGESEGSQTILRHAAPLHDVGKIGIPDSILIKPGSLTPEEYETMKRHTLIGHSILKDSRSSYLRAGAEIALTHHERVDGSGYPSGLSGGEIPLHGRIVCLVDVFDALTSRRPYKEPWPVTKALDELRKCRGTFFDPVLVDLFLDNSDEVKEIYMTYRDSEI